MEDKEHFLLLCNKLFTKFGIVIGILCIILYIGVVLSFSSNYPYWDDYPTILGYLNNFCESSTKDKILSLFMQHNEHRIFFNRIIEIIQYYAFGNVNFYYLILIGNIGWFLSIYLLIKYVRDSGYAWVCTIPIIVIMTSFAHHECMTWAMCSIQQYFQLFFALVTIHLLVRHKIFGTLFTLALSVYTGGGGLVLVPLVFLYTVLNRDLKKFFIYNIFSIFILGLYFISFNHHSSFVLSLEMCVKLCEYVLLFIGGVLRTHDSALGLGIIAIPLFFFKIKTLYQKSPFVFWSMIFVIGTSFVTGLSRVGYFGVAQALSSRYSIYPILFWSLMYIKFLIIFGTTNKKQLVLVFIAFLCSLSAYVGCFREGITYMNSHKILISTSTLDEDFNSAINILRVSEKKLGYNNWKKSMKWYVGAINSNELVYKKGYFGCWSMNKSSERCVLNDSHNIQDENVKQIIISNDNRHISLGGWSLDPISKNSPCGIIFKLNNNEYYAPIFIRPDVVDLFRNKMALYSGFRVKVNLKNFQKGNYKAELITVGEDCKTGYKAEEYNVIVQ